MRRKIVKIIDAQPTLEGAGVRLNRVFAHANDFDPFLLLDHFGSHKPEDYLKGFPWHPHRGIETVTYMKNGKVEHGDSLGNKDVITPGGVQWMTAGSGIMHQEMPRPIDGKMMGFQLWVNLPKNKKMTEPRYMSIKKLTPAGNAMVLAGKLVGKKGPMTDMFVDVKYYDISISDRFSHRTDKKTVFVYIYEGSVKIGEKEVKEYQCALLDDEGVVEMKGNGKFLLVAGNPLNEPVAWGGPIVMNTQVELQQAFVDLENDEFIKKAED